MVTGMLARDAVINTAGLAGSALGAFRGRAAGTREPSCEPDRKSRPAGRVRFGFGRVSRVQGVISVLLCLAVGRCREFNGFNYCFREPPPSSI